MSRSNAQQDARAAPGGEKTGRRGKGKRDELVRAGVAIFTEKGFYSTSVDELVAAAGVPKGSFTYYFGSKDDYTCEVIAAYGAYFRKKLSTILSDESMRPLARIGAFIESASQGMARYAYRRGCLVGNLGQELGALDDRFRAILLETLGEWQALVERCLIDGIAAGDVRQDIDPRQCARFFWYAWEGAVLGAKLEQSGKPLEIVGQTFMRHIAAT